MVNNSVSRRVDVRECADEFIVQLHIAQTFASLQIQSLKANADNISSPRGVIELPIDDSLGHNDPNLRILQAMQAAALAEMGRQLRGGRGLQVHVPQPLDLADLKRFPGAE